MKLHLPENKEAFKDLIALAGDALKIEEIYIEKDYFVVLALKGLAESASKGNGIFKGGTSLSKAYGIIQRFSEDIDMAIVNNEGTNKGSRTIMERVEKSLTANSAFTEDGNHGRVKKGTYLRQTVHTYPLTKNVEDYGQIAKHIFVDVSRISPGLPFEERKISTYIHDFLKQTVQENAITEFQLEPIAINTLSIERTFAEKFGTIVKFASQPDNHGIQPLERLKGGIRHIYDLHKLLKEERIESFISDIVAHDGLNFNQFIERVLRDDLAGMGEEPNYNHYMNAQFSECLLYGNINETWESLKPTYEGSFKRLLFQSSLPPTSEEIISSLNRLKELCINFDVWKKENNIRF